MVAPYISGLLYPQMKTMRAAMHLKQVRHDLDVFMRDPYAISKEDDLENQRYVVRVQLKPAPPSLPISIREPVDEAPTARVSRETQPALWSTVLIDLIAARRT